MLLYDCPHCGEALKIREQYVGAQGNCKKCAGKFVVPIELGGFLPDVPQSFVPDKVGAKTVLVGREPGTVLALLGMRWMYPKKWRLTQLESEQNKITLFLGDGTIRHLTVGEFSTTFSMNKQGTKFVTVKPLQGERIRIYEIGMIYEEAEFEQILELLGARESILNKAGRFAAMFVENLKEELEEDVDEADKDEES